MTENNLKAGDFTGLAEEYSKNRPDYCPSVLNALLGLFEKPNYALDVVDVGAGTGIWTRMMHEKGFKSIIAVEPNNDMRNYGILDCNHTAIQWLSGTAERTGLADCSCDWLTMASSFHWADFEKSTQEFHRVLRPKGRFTALWNPRLIEVNPLLVEVEAYLESLLPNIRRVSSGRSGITESLTEILTNSEFFDDVVYMEGRHVIEMSTERYLGAWRSVNDIQYQLGTNKFKDFIRFVESSISKVEKIEATYLTRAWSVRKRD